MNDGKKRALKKLKTARGQIDGIIRMIESDRYCIDVSTQILSTLKVLCYRGHTQGPGRGK